METGDIAILAFAAIVIVALAAFAKWAIRSTELDAEERRASAGDAQRAQHREDAAGREAAAQVVRPSGPPDGTMIGAHHGASLIRGKRVLRGAVEANGWIVLEDAELLEGRSASPLGGRQWLREGPGLWLQEL